MKNTGKVLFWIFAADFVYSVAHNLTGTAKPNVKVKIETPVKVDLPWD